MILINIPIKINCIKIINENLKKAKKKKIIIGILLGIFCVFQIILLCFYFTDVEYYKKNCPFTLTDELSEHYNKRCELYNINKNSRYSNQYICSYDPTNDFKYKAIKNNGQNVKNIEQKIEDDYLVCVAFNKEIEDNTIVTSFCNEYSNSKKYYCSRTNKPKKYSNVKDKNCKNKSKFYIGIIVILVISLLEFFYVELAICFHYYNLPYYIFTRTRKEREVRGNNCSSGNINSNLSSIFDSNQKHNKIDAHKKQKGNIEIDKN